MNNLIEDEKVNSILKQIDIEALLQVKNVKISNEDLYNSDYGVYIRKYYLINLYPEAFNSDYPKLKLFYTKYYYFLLFIKKYNKIHGLNAGLEQQLFHLIEEGESIKDIDWIYIEELYNGVAGI